MQIVKIKINTSSHRFWRSLSIAIILFSTSAQAEDIEELLNKMNSAVHSLNYTGTYVYINDGQIETMQIVHAVDKNGERERLLSLNGEAREILRDSEKVTCILPADRSVIIGKHKEGAVLPALVPGTLAELKSFYTADLLGMDRIAGYPAMILSIQPKDKMRYGYRIWLEKESGMVLRSDIIDTSGKIMEQMMFTEISLQSPVPAAMLEATVAHDTFRVMTDDVGHGGSERIDSSSWTFVNMPKGFKVKSQTRKNMPMKRNHVEHFVLSDGLATVSVYIEKSDSSDQNLEGLSSMGGVNAFGRKINNHRITVMGEVPKATVREIANSVSYRQN